MILEKMKKHILENLVTVDRKIVIISSHGNLFVTKILAKNSTLWTLAIN